MQDGLTSKTLYLKGIMESSGLLTAFMVLKVMMDMFFID